MSPRELFSLDLLYRAWERVRRKGAAGGIDGISVEDFEARIERNLQVLCDELNSQRYIPEASRRIAIPKGDGEKRMLSLPTVRDKVAQMAVFLILEERWEREFLDCSYAYRKGKGVNRAIDRVEHYLSQKLHWVATCDIDDFFDGSSVGLYKGQVQLRHKGRPARRVSFSNLRHIVVLADPVFLSSITPCVEPAEVVYYVRGKMSPVAGRWRYSNLFDKALCDGMFSSLGKVLLREKWD